MRENEGKEKTDYIHPKVIHVQSLDLGLYTAQNQGKLQKCINYQ